MVMTWPVAVVSTVDLPEKKLMFPTVDPAAVFRCEERHHSSHVLRFCATFQRAVFSHELFDLVSRPVGASTRDVVR